MKISRSNLLRVRSVLACLLVILASGHPIIAYNIPAELLWPVLACVLGLMSLDRISTVSKSALLVMLFFGLLTSIHLVIYGGPTWNASLGFFAMLSCAFLAANTIDSFPTRYVDIMSVIALIALAFYIPRMLGLLKPEHFAWLPWSHLDNGWIHAWVFNFQKSSEYYRNSGPFWEPGAFAGYLVVAMLMLLWGVPNVARWKVVVLVSALLTTTSTTGYLALVPLVALWFAKSWQGVNPLRLIGLTLISFLFALAFYVGFQKIPFLRDKIDSQFEMTALQSYNYEITRYGSLIYDLDFISQRPLVGWGASPETRQALDSNFGEIIQGQGNGFSGFAAKFGIPALLLYFSRIYFSAKRLGATVPVARLSILLISMLLFGEQFLNFPVFWCLAMLPFAADRIAPSLDNIKVRNR